MAKDFTQFDKANEFVLNKDTVINHYIKYMLTRTQSMFTYTGLPDTIPQSKLETMLQTNGYAFITEVEGKLYAFYGGLGGEPDVYGDSTEITVSNTALKLSKTYNIENDGVLINNDTMRLGLLPILNKYGALLAENTITIHTVDIILRMVCMISASDDRTYTGAEKFIKDIENGKISAIGESAFFEGVRVHSVSNTQNYLTQFIEMEQYLKASCFNEIGLNANYNMKREAIGNNESALNDDFLLPLVDNMIKERETAIQKINEKYNLELTVDFASAWKVTHEENKKQIALSESITEQVQNGENINVTVDEKKGVHDIDRPLIKIEGDKENDEDNNEHSTGKEESENGLENDTTESHNGDAGTRESEDIAETGAGETSTGENEEVTAESNDEVEEKDTTTGELDSTRTDDEESGSDTNGESEGASGNTDSELEEGEEDDRNKS